MGSIRDRKDTVPTAAATFLLRQFNPNFKLQQLTREKRSEGSEGFSRQKGYVIVARMKIVKNAHGLLVQRKLDETT